METQGLLNCKKIQAGYLRRFLRYIPILIAVGAILALTLMNTPKNVAMSEEFRKLLVRACERFGICADAWWNSSSGIRKLGHIIEYGMLGIASGIAFINSDRWGKGTVAALVLCMAVSVLDQSVKVLVPIRHFDWTDIPLDIVGSLVGIGIVVIIKMMVKRS